MAKTIYSRIFLIMLLFVFMLVAVGDSEAAKKKPAPKAVDDGTGQVRVEVIPPVIGQQEKPQNQHARNEKEAQGIRMDKPKLIPFRVFVLPVNIEAKKNSGYWRYMYVSLPESFARNFEEIKKK